MTKPLKLTLFIELNHIFLPSSDDSEIQLIHLFFSCLGQNLFIASFFLQFFGEVNYLEQALYDTESLRLEEEEEHLEDNMPFLQMLQSVESPAQFLNPLKEPNFQTLLRIQHMKKPWEGIAYIPTMESQFHSSATTLDLESCVTHDMLEMQQSPVKSESNELQQLQLQHTFSASCVEKMNNECNQEPQETTQTCHKSQLSSAREKRKRKRTRPTKNKEDVENQRMTHIAVERNRRRQMNDHLSVLRSLMPPSYIQRVCIIQSLFFSLIKSNCHNPFLQILFFCFNHVKNLIFLVVGC